MSKSKIHPGKGFQYTPQTTIKWAEEFNELLDSHSSRNELVSKLIEDGLKVQNGNYKEKGIYLPLEAFDNDQLALLKTEEGRKILYNVVSLILGNLNSAAFAQRIVQTDSSEIKSESQLVDSSDLTIEVEREEKDTDTESENVSNEALSKLMKLGKMTSLKAK